jgi:hypothetical protein
MVTDWLGRLLVRDPEGGIQCQHENRPGGRGRRSLRPTSGLLRARAVLAVGGTSLRISRWRPRSSTPTAGARRVRSSRWSGASSISTPSTLRLEPGTTKNDDGRLVHLTREVQALLQDQLERVDALQRKLGRIVPYLFPYLSGKRRAGQRRRDFRKAWTAACSAVGLAGRLRHDFRRRAVRNLERAGVPRSQAMKITGHRTEAVYRRYAIVSEADVREAVQKLDGYIHGDSSRGALDERRATL